MLGKELGAEQTGLLRRWQTTSTERDNLRQPGSVVEGSVVDTIAAGVGLADAEVIVMGTRHHVLVA